MKRFSLNKLGIGVFCTFLIGVGTMTIVTGGKDIIKSTLSGAKSGLASNGISGLLTGAIGGAESGVSSNLYAKNSFVNLYGLTAKGFGNTFVRDADAAYNIVKDNNGQLQFVTNARDDSEAIEQIITLNQTLEQKGVNFLYVQTPVKVIEGYTEMPASIVDYSNSNTDNFKAALEEGGVNVLDLRKSAEADNLDRSTLFYNTDHHWRTETAFWGVAKTVEALNSAYGMNLDKDNFYTDLNHYYCTFYDKNFLGSQGRRVGKYFGGLDDFTLIKPNFDTNYTVTINKSNGTSVKEGTFEETIIDHSLIDTKDVFTNRYASYFGADYPEVIIENHLADNDHKILIVKDSFALPYTAFLSTMVGEIRMLDFRYYDEMSVEEYVQAHDIDTVLYVYKSINTIK